MGLSIPAVAIFLLSFIAIPIVITLLISTFVYKDAKSRNMNALLWVLITILVPSFIGLIIYLVVRNDYSNLSCGQCNYPIKESFIG